MTDAPPPDGPESFVIKLETGDRVHYLDWGPPEAHGSSASVMPMPPLALTHGVAQTAWVWAPVARRLRPRTRVVAPDLRGHGLSDASRKGYELESLAMDALTVMSGNGWGHEVGGPSAVVAGHGFGALVAMTMATLRPASVAGVVLIDGGWEDMAEATRSTSAEFLAGLAEPPEVLASMDAFLADRRDFDPASWDDDQERAARAQVDQKYAGHVALVSRAAAMRGVVEAMFAYRPREAFATVAAPMLVLVSEAAMADDEGARERRLALDDAIRVRRAAGLPEPHVVRYTGAGHNLMRYRPAEVAAEIETLLERVAATSGDTRGDPA